VILCVNKKNGNFAYNPNYMKQTARILLLLSFSLLFINWGGPGHKKINESSVNDFPDNISSLKSWQTILIDHASDADNRKGSDPTEGPKHYIDIDAYPEFVSNHRITSSYDSLVLLHGKTFVDDLGILPWATLATYDSLKSCFKRNDLNKAALFAADLGHYVADGHMPLHITENYDGDMTGQSGIHSRYESAMISAYLSNIIVQIKKGVYIADVRSYVFNYLFANYTYVDSVLLADTYAKSGSGTYNSKLWSKTGNFTGYLFTEAAYSLASLIYTAWYEAQHPVSILYDFRSINSVEVNNPAHQYLHLKIEPSQTDIGVKVELVSLDLRVDTVLYQNLKSKGNQKLDIQLPEVVAGVYLLRVTSGSHVTVKKILIF
jgi:hypothetical protein